jgi:hypothetical protein
MAGPTPQGDVISVPNWSKRVYQRYTEVAPVHGFRPQRLRAVPSLLSSDKPSPLGRVVHSAFIAVKSKLWIWPVSDRDIAKKRFALLKSLYKKQRLFLNTQDYTAFGMLTRSSWDFLYTEILKMRKPLIKRQRTKLVQETSKEKLRLKIKKRRDLQRSARKIKRSGAIRKRGPDPQEGIKANRRKAVVVGKPDKSYAVGIAPTYVGQEFERVLDRSEVDRRRETTEYVVPVASPSLLAPPASKPAVWVDCVVGTNYVSGKRHVLIKDKPALFKKENPDVKYVVCALHTKWNAVDSCINYCIIVEPPRDAEPPSEVLG